MHDINHFGFLRRYVLFIHLHFEKPECSLF
jgi:hypothetical protein